MPNGKFILAIELGSSVGSICLFDSAQDLTSATETILPDKLRHAELSLSTIDGLLKEKGITSEALAGVLLPEGPGSFTGLRVGYATAKAFALSHGIPLYTVNSCEARLLGFSIKHDFKSVEVVTTLTKEKFVIENFKTPSSGEKVIDAKELVNEVRQNIGTLFLLDETAAATVSKSENSQTVLNRATYLAKAYLAGKARCHETPEQISLAAPQYLGSRF